ncbi:MAG: hypothetical protein RBS27_04265 [Giesbergeria sp.]|jgi:hypothetical protein|nr:hypothetical protein [Giesbergeria sp.]
MTLTDLLNLGITARLDTDGGLLLDAPKGALSADLLDRIRHAKPELLAELRAGREHGEHGELGSLCTNPAGKGDTLPDELHTDRPPARRPPTDSERAELLALLAAIYATDTDQDRQGAMDCAMADPDGALTCYRAIAVERGLEIVQPAPEAAPATPACGRCRHRATPGRADPGYCAIRTDQPPAYGTNHPLHLLPGDGGTGCPMFEATMI